MFRSFTGRYLGDPFAISCGELAVGAARLEVIVRDVASGLGEEAGAAQDAVARALDALAERPVPPWAEPGVTAETLTRWLADSAEVLRERDRFLVAVALDARSPRRPRPAGATPGEDGRTSRLGPGDVMQLAARCHELAQSGDGLLEGLGLRLRTGGRLFGYHAIARQLHRSLTEPTGDPDARPAGPPERGA